MLEIDLVGEICSRHLPIDEGEGLAERELPGQPAKRVELTWRRVRRIFLDRDHGRELALSVFRRR